MAALVADGDGSSILALTLVDRLTMIWMTFGMPTKIRAARTKVFRFRRTTAKVSEITAPISRRLALAACTLIPAPLVVSNPRWH